MNWDIYDRARRIRGGKAPVFATIWVGRDTEGGKRWLVNAKPEPGTAGGSIYAMQGSPSFSDAGTLAEAVERFKAEL